MVLNAIPECASGTKHSDRNVGGGCDELIFQLVKALAPGLNGDRLLLRLQINITITLKAEFFISDH